MSMNGFNVFILSNLWVISDWTLAACLLEIIEF